jgi:hypothetical protein
MREKGRKVQAGRKKRWEEGKGRKERVAEGKARRGKRA